MSFSPPKPPSIQEQQTAHDAAQGSNAYANTVFSNPNFTAPGYQTTNSPGQWFTDPNTGKRYQQWNQNTAYTGRTLDLWNKSLEGQNQFADAALKQLGNVSSMLSKPVTQANLTPWQKYAPGPNLVKPNEELRKTWVDKAMQSYDRTTDPQNAARDAQLAARGQMPGGEMAYNEANQRADARGEAGRGAWRAGGEEARASSSAENQVLQAMMNNARGAVDQNNAVRQGQWTMNNDEVNQTIGRLAQMFGGAAPPVANSPGFTGGQVNPFDVSGAMQNKFAQDQNAYSAKMSGIASILGAFAGPLAGRVFG